MRTAFMTGATGFVGQHIAEQLAASGWRIVALHRPSSDISRLAHLPVTFAEGCVEDLSAVQRALPVDCDAVFHVAGNMSFWSADDAEQTRTNVLGTRNLVSAALARGAKMFVHTSSDSAYGHQTAIPYDETATSTALRSQVNYERTKYQGELEVRAGIAQGLRAVIINPTNIVGRYDRHGWAEFVIMIARRELPSVPPGGMSFCDVEQVARAHIAALERGTPGDNYLLAGADATYLEVVQLVGRLLEVPVPKRTVPIAAFRALAQLAQWQSRVTRRAPPITPEIAEIAARGPSYVRSTKATRELGYEFVSLEDMFRKACAWLAQEGLLTADT